MKLLCRFYKPGSGRITIDGVGLPGIPEGEWLRILAQTKAALSDAVIDSAVARLPRAHFEAAGATLAAR